MEPAAEAAPPKAAAAKATASETAAHSAALKAFEPACCATPGKRHRRSAVIQAGERVIARGERPITGRRARRLNTRSRAALTGTRRNGAVGTGPALAWTHGVLNPRSGSTLTGANALTGIRDGRIARTRSTLTGTDSPLQSGSSLAWMDEIGIERSRATLAWTNTL